MARKFPLEKGIKPLVAIVFLLFSFLTVWCPVALFSENKAGFGLAVLLLVSGCVILFFGGLAFASWRILKRLPFVAVCVDEDGLWHDHLGKRKGLIPWRSVAQMRERPLWQSLDLLGARGGRLIRIEYQLAGFSDLRELIVAKISEFKGASSDDSVFSKGRWYHTGYLIGVLFFGAFPLFLLQRSNDPILLLFFLMIPIGVWEYFTTVYRLHLSPEGLTLFYPLRQKHFALSDVTSVEIEDRFRRGNRIPELQIHLSSQRKPITLVDVGMGATEIATALDRLLKPR
ncbi:MAG: hypothetical protein MI742_15310 [Desulfobacterales bacterium]|nr:hypothetical protein [Desulfobacterales bacterium]